MAEMIRADDSLKHFHKVGAGRTAVIVVCRLFFPLFFLEQIAATLGRRVTPGQSGRPRKPTEPVSGELFE